MPLKYDPDTGIPSYFPDLGEELTEGVTPKPTVISTKSDVFKGDKKPTAEEYERLRDGDKPITSEEVYRMIEEVAQRGQLSPEEFDKLKADTADFTKSARPGKLDKTVATDAELDAVEAAAKAQDIENWPMLLRLINRLRLAEGK